jgi:hypothetical protein
MQYLDSLKFVFSKELASFNLENYNKSTKEINDVEYTSYDLRNELKLSGINGIYTNDSNCIIQISSKLIPAEYYNMMNINNIERYFTEINNSGLINFDVKTVIENSKVLSCDTTNNIPNIKNVATYINPLLIFKMNDKFICKHYKNESISFTKNLKHLSTGEHLKLYNKMKELENPKKKENKDFIKTIDVEKFRNVLRVESRFNNLKLMRKHFNLSDTTLLNILNSKESVNHNILNMITNIKNIDVNSFTNFKTLIEMREQKIKRATIEKRTGMLKIIEMLNSDIGLIRMFVNTGSSNNSNNSAIIKEYKRLIKSSNNIYTDSSIDSRVNEIKNYLKVA